MTRVVWAIVAGAVLAQIAYPLASDASRDVVTVAVVLLLTAASLVHAAITRGPLWTVVLFASTAGLGLLSEVIGTATGFPFGSYFYATGRLGPEIVGVPAVVPLAWTAGFYPIWCAATFVLRRAGISGERRAFGRVLMVAVGMVGWDLYLDSQMVTDGQWTWTSGNAGLPGIPSIPYTNYLGWFAVALLMAIVVDRVGGLTESRRPRGRSMSDAAPLVLFLWTWLGSGFAHAFLLEGDEMRFSAVYGFCVMGVVGFPLVALWIRQPGKVTVKT
ncbi:carotenoid biosynthesis protein [Rhodococcus coprophilus]|uniref:Caratenoid biosynthesis protein n=1 Tax=Rhodococcus coprophilus TaxID=38310 RepID=A0A2X4U5C0_9NOCA|nr:carotenoid biosynthesis protein [Rhodococcus coprophilus]MBM7458957.1 putative membrane protein [Rhodococcus coprophilus]SQI34383.1 caratenoid biosynthesis protein [Rhodococcus coprophilus]